MSKKKGSVLLLFSILALLVIIGLVIYFGFVQQSFGLGCNIPGLWYVSAYDSQTNQITVTATASNYNSAGCIGAEWGTSKALDMITNKDFCLSFFEGSASWSDEYNKCTLTDSNWFSDKQVMSTFGTCTQTCTDQRGCGGVGLLAAQSKDIGYTVGFDGRSSILPSPYNSWTPITCSGGFVIGFKSAVVEVIDSTINNTIQDLVDQYSTENTTTETTVNQNVETTVLINETTVTTITNFNNGTIYVVMTSLEENKLSTSQIISLIISGVAVVLIIVIAAIAIKGNRKKSRR